MSIISDGKSMLVKGNSFDVVGEILNELADINTTTLNLRVEIEPDNIRLYKSNVIQHDFVSKIISEAETALGLGTDSNITNGLFIGSYVYDDRFTLLPSSESDATVNAYLLYNPKRNKIRLEFVCAKLSIRDELSPLLEAIVTNAVSAYRMLKTDCVLAITLTCPNAEVN